MKKFSIAWWDTCFSEQLLESVLCHLRYILQLSDVSCAVPLKFFLAVHSQPEHNFCWCPINKTDMAFLLFWPLADTCLVMPYHYRPRPYFQGFMDPSLEKTWNGLAVLLFGSWEQTGSKVALYISNPMIEDDFGVLQQQWKHYRLKKRYNLLWGISTRMAKGLWRMFFRAPSKENFCKTFWENLFKPTQLFFQVFPSSFQIFSRTCTALWSTLHLQVTKAIFKLEELTGDCFCLLASFLQSRSSPLRNAVSDFWY